MIADLIHKIAGMEEEAENGHEFSARPSLAGPERCIRQMVYWSLGFQKQPFPGRTILVFDDGNWHEELTNNWIRKSVYRLHSEQMQVDVRHPMTIGHIDGILTDMNGTDIFYEHKSINHFTFQKFWDTSDLPLDYLTQCAIYMDGLQKIQPEILRGLLLIKNKNTAQYMEYELAYNSRIDELCVRSKIRSTGEKKQMDVIFPNIVAEATEKFELVLEYAYKKRLPKRQYEIDDWHCSYCGWGHICWGEYEKEFTELKTDAMLPNEVADLVRYKQETSAHRLSMEKEEKELTNKIKDLMKEVDAREGKAGEYRCKLTLMKNQRIDKSLLSAEAVAKATVESMYEKLTISKLKKEVKNGSE